MWARGGVRLALVSAVTACTPRSETPPAAGSTTTGSSGDTSSPSADTSSTTVGDTTGGGASMETSSSSDAPSGGESSTGTAPEVPRWQHLIGADPYPRLVIEVDYAPGRAPREANVAQLEAVLASVLDKPGGVEVVLDVELETRPDHAWTVDERLELALATSDLPVTDDTIKIHALFLDGHAAEDDEMETVLLGVAWGFETIVMFRDTLDAGCEAAVVGPLVEQLCAEAELLIWQHEVGHVIGLVDGGLPMVEDHLDPAPGAGRHDVSHDCVMYRTYEGLDALDTVLDRLLGGGPPIQLDAACLADIAAVK